MVGGFNHNFSYKGVVYHIQTEDGGRSNPNIVTLLYHGGTILASRKTSYADIIRIDNLAQVVEELMKEQHKGLLRGLKNGEFDEVIERFAAGAGQGRPAAAAAEPLPLTDEVDSPAPPPAVTAPRTPRQAPPPPRPAEAADPPAGSAAAAQDTAGGGASLDEIILAYLLGEEK